jgi:hypothetical protein
MQALDVPAFKQQSTQHCAAAPHCCCPPLLLLLLQGKLRVTIQGETIEQQFGEREVCFR